jgi:hypothetical protein
MSTAWKLPVVLWREPWRAVGARVLGRAVAPAVTLWLAGVPGTPFTGAIPWLPLRIPVFLIAVFAALLWLFAILYLIVNRRVVLKLMPTGSIERPRSIQERLFKVHQEYAIGKTVTVTPGQAQFISQAEPRVTLSAEGTLRRIPLYKTDPKVFVESANALLKDRGIRLVLEEPEAPPGPGDPIVEEESGTTTP